MPAVDLRFLPAIAGGDAFEIDQADRDLSRDFEVPSARADGDELDSNGNSMTREAIGDSARERGVDQLRRALEPGSRSVNAAGLTASKILAQTLHC